MGTNYYHHTNLCKHCGRSDVQHIGKTTYSYSFMFEGTDTIRCYQDWLKVLSGDGIIRDEYGQQFSLEAFKALVESRRQGRNHAEEHPKDSWVDMEGHAFIGCEFS